VQRQQRRVDGTPQLHLERTNGDVRRRVVGDMDCPQGDCKESRKAARTRGAEGGDLQRLPGGSPTSSTLRNRAWTAIGIIDQ